MLMLSSKRLTPRQEIQIKVIRFNRLYPCANTQPMNEQTTRSIARELKGRALKWWLSSSDRQLSALTWELTVLQTYPSYVDKLLQAHKGKAE